MVIVKQLPRRDDNSDDNDNNNNNNAEAVENQVISVQFPKIRSSIDCAMCGCARWWPSARSAILRTPEVNTSARWMASPPACTALPAPCFR